MKMELSVGTGVLELGLNSGLSNSALGQERLGIRPELTSSGLWSAKTFVMYQPRCIVSLPHPSYFRVSLAVKALESSFVLCLGPSMKESRGVLFDNHFDYVWKNMKIAHHYFF